MGLFSLFRGDGGFKKHAARVANKRAQAQDRWESIQALAKMKTRDSAAALLVRFTYRTDPSITDQEEKDAAFQGILDAGEAAVEPVTEFLMRAESVSWPLKLLQRLQSTHEVTSALITLTERMDTDYSRDPEKKIQVVGYMAELVDERIVGALSRFLEDANDTVRFHAITAILKQPNADTARAALLAALLKDESVRNRAAILEGFTERAWDVGDQVEQVRRRLPDRFALDSAGVPRRS